MITEKQYQYVYNIYREEADIIDKLDNKAKIYLSICSFILTALLFKIKDISEVLMGSESVFAKYFLIATYSFIFFALFFTIFTLKIYSYEYPTFIEKLTSEFDDNVIDEIFIKNRTADLLVATEINATVNFKRSRYLVIASICLLLGSVSAFTFLTLIIL
ncbi:MULTISPECIES: hypothetical protein [Flavobacteriaceae]|uniref:hypothetical protein n=1 Tax=Flavobacteriaceae TaxID=49546 RepID=UPI00234A3CB7|nr:hypothetical protein [Muricauda sp. SP22]MDC6361658.1 hypothetical protein [Muricauda sp. SP22]